MPLVIGGLWLWLYRPVFDYLARIFSQEDFRTNQLVLLGALLLILTQVRRGDLGLRLDNRPSLNPLALALVLGGSTFYLIVERHLDIHTLSASLFGLASYGLLGLWLPSGRWRRGLPAALLLIGALPFGDHMQTFVGYPMRILTAGMVRDGLAALGVASIGVDTILILENGVSQVDLPCSGVKSLWTGLLFLLAATWIERRPLNLRWLGVASVFSGALFAANLGRVAVLVTVGQVAGWRLLAEMLHVPLGVLGFIAACGVAVLLLRWTPSRIDQEGDVDQPATLTRCSAWLAPGLAVVLLGMTLVYSPRPQAGLTQAPPAWNFPTELTIQPLPLKPDELAWLTRDGADSADRHRFSWRGLSGTLILVPSRTWRAHHRPERCFEVLGLAVDDSQPHLVTTEFPIRLVRVRDHQSSRVVSAAYWFQAAHRTTDDYGARLWADVTWQPHRWVLVSLVFDSLVDPRAPEVEHFLTAVHTTVAQTLAY